MTESDMPRAPLVGRLEGDRTIYSAPLSAPGYVTILCAECSETISRDATACPFCGYAPAEELWATAKWRFSVGIYCLLFIVTSPFALYFLPATGLAWWNARQATPTAPRLSPSVWRGCSDTSECEGSLVNVDALRNRLCTHSCQHDSYTSVDHPHPAPRPHSITTRNMGPFPCRSQALVLPRLLLTEVSPTCLTMVAAVRTTAADRRAHTAWRPTARYGPSCD